MTARRDNQRTFAGWAAWLCASLLFAATCAQARDLSAMNPAEVKVLQHRLTDAGCYAGLIDGVASEGLAIAKKACPDQEPALRIQTEMHVGKITQIAVDQQCKIAATGSSDKTARLWSLPEGKLLRVLHPAIGAGHAGEINAIAISPDGRFVALGGLDAHSEMDGKSAVSIFDASNGALVARVGAYSYAIFRLAYSRDGRWLAVTLSHTGLRIIDTSNWTEFGHDTNYGSTSAGAVFGPDGRLYTTDYDGLVRQYAPGPNFRLETSVATPGGKKVVRVAIDPGGDRIAVGFGDSSSVDLFDVPGLVFHPAADTRRIENNNLLALAWRADGKVLIAAGAYNKRANGGHRDPFVLFDRDGQRLDDPAVALAEDTVEEIVTCGEGFAASSAAPDFGLVDGTAHEVMWRRGVGVDMRNKLGAAFEVSDDGKRVDFGLGFGPDRPVLFDLSRATLEDSPKPPPGLNPPIVVGLPVANWRNQTDPSFAGKSIAILENEISRSLAILPNRRSFVLGADWTLRGLNTQGVVWKVATPGAAWGVNVSADSRLVVAAYSDGTIRWHRVDNGRELLALFVNRDTKSWVAWTPTGYYMASPGGEDLIGWHVNRGWNQAAEFFPASRFRNRLNRPDIVKLVLDTLDEDAAIKQANAQAHRQEDPTPLLAQLPPLIRIDKVPDAGRVANVETKLNYVWRSPSGLPVDQIEVLIDGRPSKEVGLPVRTPDADAEIKGTLNIAIPPHDVEVGLIAYSGELASEVAHVKLTWTGPVASTPTPHRLHALVAGVSDYASPDMALAYAAKDAKDFAHALQDQKGGYYSQVETRVITDRGVTRASLLEGLDWLAKQSDGPNDISVLFLAGHGLTDDKLIYWFLPADATEDQAHGKGLSQDDVRRALRYAKGQVIWFLDTCHAGAAAHSTVDVNTLVNTITSAENGGIVAFASSRGNETSLESSAWQNGAFTKALVDGIEQGKAAAFGQDEINTSLLDAYLQARVTQLTDGAQHPVMQRPSLVTDFTFAEARKSP